MGTRTPAPPEDTRNALDLSATENADLCAGCVKCCTYVAVEIDPPGSPVDYDQWIWALHHKTISIYIEKPQKWFLCVDAVCEQLNDQGRCSIYGRHPVLCREYDPRECERRLPLTEIKAWFHNAYEFEAWIQRQRPKHWARLMAYRKDQPEGPPKADVHAARRSRSRAPQLVTIGDPDR